MRLEPPYINRVEKDKNYTVVNNGYIFDNRLSLKAKGLLTIMLSRPDDWVFYLDELQTHSTDGEKSLRAGFKELQEHGYVKKFPIYENRKITRWVTVVYEVSQTLEQSVLAQNLQVQNLQVQNVQVGNVQVQKVDVGFVDVQKEALLSTDINQVLNKQSIDEPIIDIQSTHKINTEKLSTEKDRPTDDLKDSFKDSNISNGVDSEKEKKTKAKTVGLSVHSSLVDSLAEKITTPISNDDERIEHLVKSYEFADFGEIDNEAYMTLRFIAKSNKDTRLIGEAVNRVSQQDTLEQKPYNEIMGVLADWKSKGIHNLEQLHEHERRSEQTESA